LPFGHFIAANMLRISKILGSLILPASGELKGIIILEGSPSCKRIELLEDDYYINYDFSPNHR